MVLTSAVKKVLTHGAVICLNYAKLRFPPLRPDLNRFQTLLCLLAGGVLHLSPCIYLRGLLHLGRGMGRLKSVRPRLQSAGASRLKTVATDSWRAGKQSSTQRGYGYKWQQARKRYLQAHPLCVFCQQQGRVTAADVVDHIVPHQGNDNLFWDTNNWQPLCASCHSSTKQAAEAKGRGGVKSSDNPPP